jgi:hypothetical protein
MTSSTAMLYTLWPLVFPITVGVVLCVLARRTHISGLWWLFVALGIWPVIQVVVSQSLMLYVARLGLFGIGMLQLYYLWFAAAFGTIGAALQIVGVVKLARLGRPLPAQPRCPRCGYNLTGLPDDRCPECGTQFTCELRYLTRTV